MGKIAIALCSQGASERLHVAVHEVLRLRQELMHGLACPIAIALCDRVINGLVHGQEDHEGFSRDPLRNRKADGDQIAHVQQQGIVARHKDRAVEVEISLLGKGQQRIELAPDDA